RDSYKGKQFSKIIVNDPLAAEQLMRRLLEKGHRNIAGVFVYDNYQSIEKYKGYVRSLRSFGAAFNDDHIKWSVSGEAHDPHFLSTLTRFIRGIPECTAIVCCNYMLLQLVLTALKTLGRRVPEDCSIVCFDYSGFDWKDQDITCSVHPSYEIGVQAAREMLRRLDDKKQGGSTFIIDPLIHTGSSIASVSPDLTGLNG
ncbi:MAG: substrate-binding domain-containing protein, partial [Clostridiales bacterium]|nr:substrate-binding domain-containing protein [Clostridiales bacterium]